MTEGHAGEEEGAGRGREVCSSAAAAAAAAENPLQTDAFPLLQHGRGAALKLPALNVFFLFHADPSEGRKLPRQPPAHPFVLSRARPFHVA